MFTTIFIISAILQVNEDKELSVIKKSKTTDSLNLENHFSQVIRTLKSDTAALRITNDNLRATKDDLRSKLDNNSFELAKRITKSGVNLISQMKASADSLDDKITGGHGYPTIYLVPMGKGDFDFSIENESKYALPNVRIKALNIDGLESCPSKLLNGTMKYSTSCFEANSREIDPDFYNPKIAKPAHLPQYFFRKDGRLGRMEFTIVTVKSRFIEQFIYRIAGEDKSSISFRILEDIGNSYKVVYMSPAKNTTNFNLFFKSPSYYYPLENF